MVDRRRLSRLRTKAQEGGMVIELKDGSTEVFPKRASLEFCVACWQEGIAAEKGIEYSWHPETNRLKKALENATPESYAEFNAKYAIIWEEDSY
jgi:coenzyme F420-reducing hydrogenase beta subunit